MELSDLLQRVGRTLEELSIPYLVTGSVATIAYGEPRFTNDIDVVVRLHRGQVEPLCAAFPGDEFYVSTDAVYEAVEHKSQFNILYPRTGLKVDVMVADESEFNMARFSRTRRLETAPAVDICFASPEDVIIKKLQFYLEGGSEKHLRDIAGVIKVVGEDLDHAYIEHWVQVMELDDIWSAVLEG
jgi:hypothetical protein